MSEPAKDNPPARSTRPGSALTGRKRLKLLACEIMYRELCLLVSQSENIIDVEFFRKGLHDAGSETMSQTIQMAINTVPTKDYEAILLAYGRCNNGVVGIKAPDIPLVIPRVHDCISLFFGSRLAYEEYFAQDPGTSFRTTGDEFTVFTI